MNVSSPDLEKLATLCKMCLKTQCNDLEVIFDLYSIDNNTKTRYSLFKLINFIFYFFIFCKYTLIVTLKPATSSTEVETGASKDWESYGMLKKPHP